MRKAHPILHKVVSLVFTPTTPYPLVNSNCIKGLIEMKQLDAQG